MSVYFFVLRTKPNPLARRISANLHTLFSARGSYTSPRSARGIAVARRYSKRFAHQVGYAKSLNPRTAFPYLFAARDKLCALHSCFTDCIFLLLARQYTAYAVCTKGATSWCFSFFRIGFAYLAKASGSLLTSAKRRYIRQRRNSYFYHSAQGVLPLGKSFVHYTIPGTRTRAVDSIEQNNLIFSIDKPPLL